MPKFRIALENVGGELAHYEFDGDEAELAQEAANFIIEIGSLRDGDAIRVTNACKHRDNGRGICADCGSAL
jgi:hypothetical protein